MASSLRSVFPKFLKSGCYSLLSSKNYSKDCKGMIKVTASKLFYKDYGDPVKVLKKETEDVQFDPNSDHVLVHMLASPVNPADINTIQGKYPVKPPLPSVPGNEGVAEIVAVGNEVADLDAGDRVVPLTNALGTWRTHMILPAEMLFKVPKDLDIPQAATLTVNPCTAYRMLKDFVHLKSGDTVIQNGANSTCGQNVIQICKAWDVNTVNVVRDRPNIKELKDQLKALGATEVLTEEELRKTDIFKTAKLDKPRLALNCVGGKSATELLRHVSKGGMLVTYGGMSREPVTVSTASLIFNDVELRGFWMTRWTIENAESSERMEMMDDLINMMTSKEIRSPSYKMVPFDNYLEALNNTMTPKGMTGKKFILEFKKANNC